jgi:DNA-directed RNA polymerase subunit RPC12/RpoP
MPIIMSRKYICKKCKNTFVRSEGDVITTNLICQECGGQIESVKMNLIDYVNPLERAKSLRHFAKGVLSHFSKK